MSEPNLIAFKIEILIKIMTCFTSITKHVMQLIHLTVHDYVGQVFIKVDRV